MVHAPYYILRKLSLQNGGECLLLSPTLWASLVPPRVQTMFHPQTEIVILKNTKICRIRLSRIIQFSRLFSIELCQSKILSCGQFSEVQNNQCLAPVKWKLTANIDQSTFYPLLVFYTKIFLRRSPCSYRRSGNSVVRCPYWPQRGLKL